MTFSVSGSGTVDTTSASTTGSRLVTITTGSDGIARLPYWKPVSGGLSVSAASAANTLQFTATVLPRIQLQLYDGMGQNVPVGTVLPASPAVLVTDQLTGAVVSGISVTFTVTGGGGSVTGATAVSNSLGVARVGSWTVGPAPGANSLLATANYLQQATAIFTATAH